MDLRCSQETQNPPTLAVMGVRPPLPAPALNQSKTKHLQMRTFHRAQNCAHSVPKFPSPASKIAAIAGLFVVVLHSIMGARRAESTTVEGYVQSCANRECANAGSVDPERGAHLRLAT
jgi:hypothetical protein